MVNQWPIYVSGCMLSKSLVPANTQIIDRINRREQLFSGLYASCFALAVASACLLPLIQALMSAPSSGQPELPFPSEFPWDNRIARNYLASYVWNASAGVGVILFAVSMDTVFCSLTCNLCALFEIAQSQMKRFRGVTLSETQTNLRNILILYQKSLEMSLTLNRLLRPLINMQFLLASLHLCVLSYQLSEKLANLEVLHYAAFTSSVLTLSVRQPLRLTMMRAQRGCRIDGHFFKASMEIFMAIIKTAMSYVTLLSSPSE
ncbi:odorant receptor 47a [Drosophila navojoa]|nr:odorant receptor 47a [Drosophila navojoa]